MGLLAQRKPNVQKLRRRGDVAGLRNALRYRDVYADEDGSELDLGVPVRIEAAEALSQLGSPEAAAALGEALADPQAAVRLAAIEGLSKFEEPTAVEPLLDCLIGSNGEVAEEVSDSALSALTAWRLPGLADVFVERLQANGTPLEERHLHALGELLGADPRGAQAESALAARLVGGLEASDNDLSETGIEDILGRLGPAAADSVVPALANGSASPALIRAAGAVRDVRAVDPLVRLLSAPETEARSSAATALRGLNDTRAVPALLTATQDPDQSVRDAASQALNGMGIAAVIVGLAALVRDEGKEQITDLGRAEQIVSAVRQERMPSAEQDERTASGEPDERAADAESEELPSERPAGPVVEPLRPSLPAGPRRRGGLLGRLMGRVR